MDQQRLDQWLWQTRMFKSRGLASNAVRRGQVRVNDARAKVSRPVKVGDRIEIRREGFRQSVEVLGLAWRRGPFSEARLLYNESAASIAERKRFGEQHRHERSPSPLGRPDKRERRQIHRFTGKGRS